MIEPAIGDGEYVSYRFPSIDRFLAPGWREEAVTAIRRNEGYFLISGISFGIHDRALLLRGAAAGFADFPDGESGIGEFLDRLTGHLLEQVDLLCSLDVDGIIIGDDWGEQRGVAIGAERWRRLIGPRLVRCLRSSVLGIGKIKLSDMPCI